MIKHIEFAMGSTGVFEYMCKGKLKKISGYTKVAKYLAELCLSMHTASDSGDGDTAEADAGAIGADSGDDDNDNQQLAEAGAPLTSVAGVDSKALFATIETMQANSKVSDHLLSWFDANPGLPVDMKNVKVLKKAHMAMASICQQLWKKSVSAGSNDVQTLMQCAKGLSEAPASGEVPNEMLRFTDSIVACLGEAATLLHKSMSIEREPSVYIILFICYIHLHAYIYIYI